MKCNKVKILLSAYVDGEVTEKEKQTVEAHLDICETCKTTMAEFSRLHTLYQGMEIQEAPPGFRQRVTQRIETTPRFVFSWLPWRLPRLVYVLSFSLLVLLSGVIIALHVIKPPTETWQQMSLDVDVYAEDILFDQAVFSMNRIFSVGETSVAEEILDTIDFAGADTSFFFSNDHPSQNYTLRTFKITRYVSIV